MIYNDTLNNYRKVCNSYKVCIVFFVMDFLIIVSINSPFIYFHCYLKSDTTMTLINPGSETIIY